MTATARALLLDIGGVVLAPGPTLVNELGRRHPRLADVLAPLGGISGPGDDLWQRMLTREVSERAYWEQRSREITAALDLAGGDTRALMDVLYDKEFDDYLRPEVIGLMHDVKAAGLQLAALTNDMADFHGQDWVDRQKWLALFDDVVDASRTGVLKPDPRAYAAAIDVLGLPPDQIVYLDDMPWNVEGGRIAGLQALAVPHGDCTAVVADARRRLGLPA